MKFRGDRADLYQAAGFPMRTDLKVQDLVRQGYIEQYGGNGTDLRQFQQDCTHSSSIPGYDASGTCIHFCLFCGLRLSTD